MSAVTILPHLTPKKFRDLGSKKMVKCDYLNNRIYAALTSIGFVLALLIWSSCGEGPFHPVSEMEEKEIETELKNRSFHQFDPDDIDASPRKGIVLDFFDGLRLWAQYAESDYAINEWEIFAEDYRVEKAENGAEIKIHFNEPTSERTLPNQCEDCIET